MPTKTALRETWLVQRLCKPYEQRDSIFGPDNPFAFGGGLHNGGLSSGAMDLLRPIFRFDYMGAAEFEFGAVPKALGVLAENQANLVADTITIPLDKVAKGWDEKTPPAADAEATVYLLCQKGQRAEVAKRVRELAAKDYTLKEATRFPSTLRPSNKYDSDTVGWLELDNAFMFFTDRDMWAATCRLFDVEVPA